MSRVNRIALVVLLLSLGGAIGMLKLIDRSRQGATLQEVLYIRSPKALKRMSLGYTGLLADIYWTRAVQYFGDRHARRAADYALLPPLLTLTTELDPKLIMAYRFGGNFLAPKPPGGAGVPDQAIALLENGIRHNPDNWKLYYDLGFVYYMDVKDYAKAAEAFERGSKVPNAHPFLSVLAAQMAQHAGEFEMARILWTTTYQSTTDKMIRQNAVDHLRALRVDQDVNQLEQLVQRYRERAGQLPRSMWELQSAGLIRSTPADPDGHPYKITPDGRVEVQDPDSILYITKGLPPGHESPRPK